MWTLIVRGRYKRGGARADCRLADLLRLSGLCVSCQTGLGSGLEADSDADAEQRSAISGDDRGTDRDDNHALDAVLLAGGGRRKRSRYAALRLCRLDVIVGCIVTDVIAFFIVVACGATIFHSSIAKSTTSPKRRGAAAVRRKICDAFVCRRADQCVATFGGDSAAGDLLTTSVKDWGLSRESRRQFSEAPIFYWLYTLLIVWRRGIRADSKAAFVESDLLFSQVANGILLPFVLVLYAAADQPAAHDGEFTNKLWQNVIAWSTATIMIALTSIFLYNTIRDLGKT